MFIDSTVLQTIISVVGVCPDCDSRELKLCNDLSKKKGLANHIEIRCGSCGYCYSIYTSKEVHHPNTPGQKPFDVNARCIIAFRGSGRGHSAIGTFCGVMNCAPPMTDQSFNDMNKEIAASYRNVANVSMQNAAKELRAGLDDVCDVSVSCDGSWQKRGFAS